MPFHLAPLSRREFLRRTLAASAGLLTIPAFRSSAAEVDPDRWALFSDTHISEDAAAVVRETDMAAHLRSAVAQVLALPARPAGLFINGDCSLDHGIAADYTMFQSLLRPTVEAGIPLHLGLGNHDDREVFWNALQDAKPATPLVASKQVSVIESPKANWFLLDSLEVTKQTPGRLGEEQRAWLAKALDARTEKPALVLVHHNPQPADAPKKSGLLDSTELLEILTPRRHVKALFFGHTHTWRQTEQDGLHLINLPAVAYPFKPEELTGWVDCKLRVDGATLDPRAHDTAHPQHGKVVDLQWRS